MIITLKIDDGRWVSLDEEGRTHGWGLETELDDPLFAIATDLLKQARLRLG